MIASTKSLTDPTHAHFVELWKMKYDRNDKIGWKKLKIIINSNEKEKKRKKTAQQKWRNVPAENAARERALQCCVFALDQALILNIVSYYGRWPMVIIIINSMCAYKMDRITRLSGIRLYIIFYSGRARARLKRPYRLSQRWSFDVVHANRTHATLLSGRRLCVCASMDFVIFKFDRR